MPSITMESSFEKKNTTQAYIKNDARCHQEQTLNRCLLVMDPESIASIHFNYSDWYDILKNIDVTRVRILQHYINNIMQSIIVFQDMARHTIDLSSPEQQKKFQNVCMFHTFLLEDRGLFEQSNAAAIIDFMNVLDGAYIRKVRDSIGITKIALAYFQQKKS